MRSAKVKQSDIDGWRLYACDFESTTASVSEEQTKVWSFCYDEVGHYEPAVFGSIEAFFDFCADVTKGYRKRLYFHNLKFDGNFILWYLVNVLHFQTRINAEKGEMERLNRIVNGEMVYVIADTGQWYYIGFKYQNILVEIRDSLKILPFTLKQIGNAFCTKYKKSEMDYDGKTSLKDCSEADIEYIKNDVLVLSEALSFIMRLNGEETPFIPIHSLTIGGACLQEFKQKNYGENVNVMPKLQAEILPVEANIENAERYIRSGYRGGYCYVNEDIQGKTIDERGFTADVNSLYPFVMCYEYSGNSFPYGKGVYKTGRPPKEYEENDVYYFYMRIKVSFVLRDGFVPTIQKKNSFLFLQNAYLRSSAIMDYKTKTYKGDPIMIDLTLSKDDWVLFQNHYKILKIEYIDYISFMTAKGIFDEYIKEFAKIKQESKGAVRSLAKLFQNNLYGQMAKSTNSSYKILDEDTSALEFHIVKSDNKKPVNIAIGASITAKARRYQIETIQANISRFCYSDTDSLHCIGVPSDFVGKVDDKIYGAYKIENEWRKARFVRQKTYIEELFDGSFNICSAGMTDAQKDWFRQNCTFEDFKIGLTIKGGKLKPKSVKGGVILTEVDFTIR